jgi:uncharacterized membrane protein
MKKIIGRFLIAFGFLLGVYVGVWQCFILGIVGIIDAIRIPDSMTSMQLAWAILKVLCSSFFGWAVGIVPMVGGFFLALQDD